MGIRNLSFCLAFLILFFNFPLLANYLLKDVIDADERIGKETPSLFISDITGKFLKIKGKRYQIRQFVFEINPLDDHKKKNITFFQLINKYDQLSKTPKQAPGVLYSVDYFTSTPQMNGEGFYYLLSLREIIN